MKPYCAISTYETIMYIINTYVDILNHVAKYEPSVDI